MPHYNKTINDGPYGSFQADPAGAIIPIYTRCKFVTPVTATPDGTPMLQACTALERSDVITMQPIAAGQFGDCKFANAGGEQFGIMNGAAASGVQLYAAAAGEVSTSSAGGALLLGKSTRPGVDNGVITYLNHIPAA